MISIRLDQSLLDLLSVVSDTPNTVYTGKTRTHLIEEAVKETYKTYNTDDDREPISVP